MNDNSSGVPDAGTSEEPALTQRDTATVHAEGDLSAEASSADDGGASAAGGSGGAPTYGPAGNTTDAEEEGADGQGI
ncbi:MAG TPA: hypothetical protein VGT98_14510 [Candidatus Elarobacter sp.]|nr:hypothetical protein [Candidatus Elarobacter sp.]HEV2737830.1 hypothetical protein [Candidatus Elarobacter sp.]